MNTRSLDQIKAIDRVIRRIHNMQSDMPYMPYFNQAIESLKLCKLQIAIDASNRERLKKEMENEK